MIPKMLVRSLPCLAVLALVGCGPATGSISGKVTYKDKPLTGGTVTFLTSDNKVKTAIIKTDGNYTIDKVAVGDAKIGVTPPVSPGRMPGGMKMDPSKMGAPAGEAPTVDDKPMVLPDKYKDPEKSGLTYTVIKGNQDHNIEMK